MDRAFSGEYEMSMPLGLSTTESDKRWAAVIARDPTADGAFFYAVTTTGVYCRPSCGARLPRPENVRFHASRASAERAGFRPCKRCSPIRHPKRCTARRW